jgi:hypothetical protein
VAFENDLNSLIGMIHLVSANDMENLDSISTPHHQEKAAQSPQCLTNKVLVRGASRQFYTNRSGIGRWLEISKRMKPIAA